MTAVTDDYDARHLDPEDEPPTTRSSAERAIGVETVVVPERGQWAVDIVVIFPDSVVRHRIATYRSEAVARLSANYIRRGAERDIGGPING
jgi:hypothetical protein